MMGNAAKQNIAYFKQNLICDKIARNLYLNKAAEHDALQCEPLLPLLKKPIELPHQQFSINNNTKI